VIPIIIILFLILLVIGLIIGFLQLEFIDKEINSLEDWFHKKKLEDKARDISHFSLKRFVGISSTFVVIIFERIDKIEDVRLKIGIKIDSLIILTSITLAIIYFLIFFIVTIIDFIPLYILIFLLLLSFGLLLGFVKTEFADSINSRVENWCQKKKIEYKTKDIKRFSRDGIVKLVSSVVIKIFKYIDKIQDPRLKAGIKIDSLILVISITISLIVLLIISAVTLLIAVVYLILILIGLYLAYQLMELWYRYEKGLPLFPDKDTEYYEVKTSFWDKVAGKDRKTIYDSEGDKVGDISTGFWDNAAGNDRKTIRDSKGDKVGDISTGFWDNAAGNDRKTIRDSKGDKVGDISTGFWDNAAGNDRKTIRDAKGDKVGDIKTSPGDKDTQIVRMKKSGD